MATPARRNQILRLIAAAGLTLAVCLLASCDDVGDAFKREAPSSALAVVGDEWITRADVMRELNSLELDTVRESDVARYVNRWIDRRLLLHEARQAGLDQDPEVQRRLQELEAELLISELLRQSTSIEEPTPAQIVEYWKNHTGEYMRVSDEVTLVIGRVDSKNAAWRLREGFDQSLVASQMIEEIGVTRFDTLRTISVKRLPGAIAEAIEPLKSGHASLPVNYQDEWLIVKVLDRFDARTTRPVEEVEDLLKSRMVAEERSRRERDFVDALRQEASQNGFVRIRYPRQTAARPDTSRGDAMTAGETPAAQE